MKVALSALTVVALLLLGTAVYSGPTSTAQRLGATLSTTPMSTLNVGATGSTGGSATVITAAQTKRIINITSGAASSAIILPPATVGDWLYLVSNDASLNADSVRVNVYPYLGEAFYNSAANLNTYLYWRQLTYFWCTSAGVWDVAVMHRWDGTYFRSAVPVYSASLRVNSLILDSTLQTFFGNITFAAATGSNNLTVPDNLAEGIWLGQGSTRFLSLVTTDGGEMVTHQKPLRGTIATPVAAAGTDKTNCTAIVAGTVWVQVTAANGTTGVCLPTTTSVTTCVQIMNQAASALKVYPLDADNGTVNGGGSDVAYSQVAGTSLTYCNASTAWTTY